MKIALAKLKEQRVLDNLVIEATADLTMLSMGSKIGYYFKTLML